MAKAEEKLTPPTPFGEKAPRKKITSRNLEIYQKQMYFANVIRMTEASYKGLIEKMESGNVKAIEMGLKILNILKPDSGISVNVNNRNENQNIAAVRSDTPGGIQSFESILRRLEVADGMTTAIPAAPGEVLEITAVKETANR